MKFLKAIPFKHTYIHIDTCIIRSCRTNGNDENFPCYNKTKTIKNKTKNQNNEMKVNVKNDRKKYAQGYLKDKQGC